MKNLTTSVISTCLCLFMLFALRQNSYSQIYEFSHTMTGAQENPPVISSGTATIKGTYNASTLSLSWQVSFSGLTGGTTAAHFHGPATPTTNAGVRVGWASFPTTITSGSYSKTQTITGAFGAELINGQWYANIHTSFAPGGEIRAHLFPKLRTLNLSALIEGFYDNGTNLMIPDTLTVNLRGNVSPYPLIESSKANFDAAGQGVLTYSIALSDTSYYLQIHHRNSIETWSATPQTFTNSALSYDLTTSDAQAYGNNLKLKGSEYTIFSGDVNQDGAVELSDIVSVFNDAAIFNGGYISTDVNGDGVADLGDIIITFNNASSFVAAVTPP